MKIKLFLTVLIACICSACSVNVSPIASPTGTINLADNSITETRNDVAFTVKLDTLSVAPYQMVDNITSFYVVIENKTDTSISYPSEHFVLKDGASRQYRSITPERVRDIVSKDTVYLIPYPYVGYYYLEDQALVSFSDTFSSSEPFYAEYHPQDLFTQALPEGPILKQSKVAGLVYFIADLERTDRAEVFIFPTAEATGEPIASFSFAVKK